MSTTDAPPAEGNKIIEEAMERARALAAAVVETPVESKKRSRFGATVIEDPAAAMEEAQKAIAAAQQNDQSEPVVKRARLDD